MNDGTAEATETATPWWQRLATGLKRSSSALGGAKIAEAICQLVTGHDFAAGRSVIIP